MWHVPANDSIFKELTEAEWLWYFYSFMEDEEKEFIVQRDMVEYLASFIEPEAVKKIKDARDKAVEVPEKEFMAGIKHFLGRDFDIDRRPSGKIQSVDTKSAIIDYHNMQKMKENIDNISTSGKHSKDWLEFDLE
jgi:hypothetical protein